MTTKSEIGIMGITPAYAGKRQYRQLPLSKSWDHPRLCGEKRMIDRSVSWVRGSPPPMRGKDHGYILTDLNRRITPAYAGKRS